MAILEAYLIGLATLVAGAAGFFFAFIISMCGMHLTGRRR